MGIEIERKFLVKGNKWKNSSSESVRCLQGYLPTADKMVVRVRIYGDIGFLTIKGKNKGLLREEYEYEIPLSDAENMIASFCESSLIEKIRYIVDFHGTTWEIDEFEGKNKGLIIAEVELEDEDQKVVLPEWIDKEVSGDPKYYNSNLVNCPYSQWIEGKIVKKKKEKA